MGSSEGKTHQLTDDGGWGQRVASVIREVDGLEVILYRNQQDFQVIEITVLGMIPSFLL